MDPSYNPRQPSLSWKIHELLKCDENALEFFGNVRAKKIFTGIDFLDRLGLENEDSGDSGPTNDFHGGSGGLLSGQFISISGDHGSGKSELLVHAAVKSALSDDFGGQEYDTSEKIKTFCEVNYGIDFPMTEAVGIRGDDAHPYYQWVAEQGVMKSPRWNFHKHLIDRDGNLVEWFASTTPPNSPKVIRAIEGLLE